MNVLLLESCYSSFHKELASSLGGKVYKLFFDVGYILYLDMFGDIVLAHKHIKKSEFLQSDLESTLESRTLYSEASCLTTDDAIYMARYMTFLRGFLKENSIDVVLMHNDLRWQHTLAINVCRELAIPYSVTERGLFRPSTTTLDFKGVNANSSLAVLWDEKKEAYMSCTKTIDYSSLAESRSKSFMDKYRAYAKFGIFIVLSKLGDLFKLNTPLKNKEYSLVKYLKLYISQFKSNKKEGSLSGVKGEFLFVPLQVSTDTQILIHSDFDSVQSFISLVEESFYGSPDIKHEKYKLVFKYHPMEEGGLVEYKFDSRSVVSGIDTGQLVRESVGVVTINSTVGFEALCLKKPVAVLGRAFYKLSEFTFPVVVSQEGVVSDLSDVLLKIVNGERPSLLDDVERFIEFVREESQIEGDLFNYSDNTVQQAKKKILTCVSGRVLS